MFRHYDITSHHWSCIYSVYTLLYAFICQPPLQYPFLLVYSKIYNKRGGCLPILGFGVGFWKIKLHFLARRKLLLTNKIFFLNSLELAEHFNTPYIEYFGVAPTKRYVGGNTFDHRRQHLFEAISRIHESLVDIFSPQE